MIVDAMLADELIESMTTVGECFEKNSEGIFYFVTFQPVTIKTSVILYENKEKKSFVLIGLLLARNI